MVVEIPLTKGYVAIVDDADSEMVLEHKWMVTVMAPHRMYASRKCYATGTKRTIYLARWLVSAGPGVFVDHINRNTLDNRRMNLRLATPAQNQANGPAKRGRRYKGAHLDSRRNVWTARIMVNGCERWLGRFKTEEEAARAYDSALLEAHGEFALLNFPLGPQES